MENLGLSMGYLWVQLCNIGLLIGWPVTSIWALLNLRRQQLPPTAKALWALIVLAIPYLGALAYWLVMASGKPRTEAS